MKIRLLVVAVAVISVIAGMGLRAALASSSNSTPNRTLHGGPTGGQITLVFHTHALEYQRDDLGAAGPSLGDVFTGNGVLFNSHEQAVGKRYQFCGTVDTADGPGEPNDIGLCTESIHLSNGTIEIQGMRPLNRQEKPDTIDFKAIVGGTGAYERASGEVEYSISHHGAETITIEYVID